MQQKSVATRGGEQVWKQQILRRGTALEVGNLIAWLLCDQSKYITGTVQVGLTPVECDVLANKGRSLTEGGFVRRVREFSGYFENQHLAHALFSHARNHPKTQVLGINEPLIVSFESVYNLRLE